MLAAKNLKDDVPNLGLRSAGMTIGLLGCGVVGGGVAARLLTIETLLGIPVRLGRVLVRDLNKPRQPEAVIPLLTTDPHDVIGDRDVHVVVEAIGGVEPARSFVEAALRAGKHVVTSNKALIAAHGAALSLIAQQNHAALRYEASVAGAIPVVRTLAEILSAEDVIEIAGVLNGTSNFVVNAMREGNTLEDAIRRAQEAGYAEIDPSDDLDGVDAARKLAVLAPLAFRARINADQILRTSLRTLTPKHFAEARELGASIVPLALIRRNGERIEALVSPVLVPEGHEFARLRGPENVVRVQGTHSGALSFSGHGAGRSATASAVLADLAEIARRRARWQAQSVAPIDFRETTPRVPALPRRGELPVFEFETPLATAGFRT
ncbi:MAG TPA: homoserine dehydrogenase [Candidatus Acidoferrales bacterium]|nr:homoserine dehydrogenase [Candidatus Acidoferrales bacterium]